MTAKQAQVLKNLPAAGYNLAESMRKSGYKPASIRAGTQYASLRRLTQSVDFFSPDKIRQDISNTRKLAKKIPDLKEKVSALSRIDEHRSKIAGMQKDVVENKNPDKVVIVSVEKSTNPVNIDNQPVNTLPIV